MKFSRRTSLHLAAGAAALQAVSCFAWAQAYPTRPVTMVVTFAAGGGNDVLARIVAPRMSELLGQQVVIENVPGAGGMTGGLRVARATPDGYQFVYGNLGTHAQNQSLYKRPLYNAATDFTPIGLFATTTKVLVVRKNLPVDTLPAFIAYARANQGTMQFGSAGAGSATHLACVLLNATIGVQATHVPYRSAGQVMQDLIPGRIDYMCDTTQTSLPQIQEKTVKAIAFLSLTRTAVLPELPTAHEQGLSNFDGDSWAAFFAPKGTPDAIVRRLNKAMSDTVDTPFVRERLEALGAVVVPPERRTPEYIAKFVPAEIEKWAGLIKASGVLID